MQFSAYLGVVGLADVGYRFYDIDEVALAARSETGVVDAGAGWYSVSIALPATAYSVRWDSTGTAAAVAREYFEGPSVDIIVDSIGSAGLGAYAITQTVTDDAAAVLAGAIVRLYDGATNFVVTTNGSGVASFSLDAGSYTRSITKGGYSFTPDTLVVSGSASVTSVMTDNTGVAPADPTLCNVTGTLLEPDGSALATTTVTFRLHAPRNSVSGGPIIQTTEWDATTNASGVLNISLLRTDQFQRPNAYYEVTCIPLGWHKKKLTLAASTFDLATL